MRVNQREIVLIPYPFSDLEGTKVRPALVISNDIFNKKSEDCIMIPLTTVIKNEPYSVVINQRDLSAGKILKPSRIRIDKIFSVKKSLISMKIGIIKENVLRKIKIEIEKIF